VDGAERQRNAPVRIFVSADIEGVVGVVARDQGRPTGFEYEQARTWMTDGVLAVCSAAREAGVTEVVVADSHGHGYNVQLERMPDYVQLVRSWPRPLGMMQGIELGSYAGALLVGYHAGATNPGGVLSHTLSSDLFQEIRLNEQVVSEAALSAAIAGHFGVPVLMVAGDDVFVDEARLLFGDVPAATLKTAYGTSSALNPSLAVAASRLRDATRAGIAGAGERRPHRLEGPVSIDLRLRTRSVADWLAYLPGVERTGAFAVQYRAEDIIATSRFLMFVTFAKSAFA
jgi:D-amino peptidase